MASPVSWLPTIMEAMEGLILWLMRTLETILEMAMAVSEVEREGFQMEVLPVTKAIDMFQPYSTAGKLNLKTMGATNEGLV